MEGNGRETSERRGGENRLKGNGRETSERRGGENRLKGNGGKLRDGVEITV